MGRRFFFGFLTMLALCGVVAAGPAPQLMPLGVDTLVIPAASPLKFKSFDKGEITASFAGRLVLSGTYHYGTDLYLELDPQSRALLPYWKNRPGDGTVSINNEADFVRAVIPAATIKRFHAANDQGSVTGHVSIVADTYQAMIVCDAPDYSVRFVSLATTNVAALSGDPAQHGC
jgi:hypothetical protein